jgi:hypothetical protein
MPTIDEYASQPREARMQRLSRTADELAAALAGRDEDVLGRRPDPRNWAPRKWCATCATPRRCSGRAWSRSW